MERHPQGSTSGRNEKRERSCAVEEVRCGRGERGAWTRWEQNLMSCVTPSPIVSHVLLGNPKDDTSSCQNHLQFGRSDMTWENNWSSVWRPDLVLNSATSKQVIPLEPPVPWENHIEGSKERNKVRSAKLVEEFQQNGWIMFSGLSLCRAYHMQGITEGPSEREFQGANWCDGPSLTQQSPKCSKQPQKHYSFIHRSYLSSSTGDLQLDMAWRQQ